MNTRPLVLLAGIVFGSATFASEPVAAEWTTLRGNLQCTAFYPQFPKGPLKLAWRKELWRELTGPRAVILHR